MDNSSQISVLSVPSNKALACFSLLLSNAFQVTALLRLNDFSTHRVAFEPPSLSLLVNGQTHLSTGRG